MTREASLEEIAEDLGVSQQALSERIRRAHRTLGDRELESNVERFDAG